MERTIRNRAFEFISLGTDSLSLHPTDSHAHSSFQRYFDVAHYIHRIL